MTNIDYANYLREMKMRDNTVRAYVLDINSYHRWFEGIYGVKCTFLRKTDVSAYIEFIKEKTRPGTINRILSSLSKYNEYLINMGIETDSEISKRLTIKSKVDEESISPNDQDIEHFINQAEHSCNERNHAIVMLLAYSGLNISEILNFKLEDIDITNAECISRKNGKTRVIPLHPKAVSALNNYLAVRSSKDCTYLFVSRKGNRLNRTVINRLFNKLGNGITPRQLRNYFVSKAISRGVPLTDIAFVLGNKGISTNWASFVEIDDKQLKLKLETL